MASQGPTKVITVTADVKSAIKNLKKLDSVVEELQEDVWEGERALNTWKNQMAKTSKPTAEMHNKLRQLNRILADTKQRLKEAKIEQKLANNELKKAKENSTELSGATKMLDKATGGMVTRLKGSITAFKGLIKGARLTTVAMLAIPIVPLIVALTSLTAMFKSSEEGQERWERGMAMVGAIVKVVIDLFADLGDLVFKVFTGQWDELGDALDKVRDGFKNVGKDIVEEANAMNEVTKMRQKAHHVERELLIERAEANQKINDIRLEAEKRDKYSAEERVKMLKQAQKLEEDITNKEIENKERLVDAQKMEMKQGKNSREDKDKLAELEKELIDLDTKRLRGQRLLQTQITTAQNQEIAEKKEKNKEIERLEEEHQNNLKQIKGFTIIDEEQKRQAQRDALKLEYETLMQLAKDDKDAQFDLEFAYLEKLSILQKGFDDADIAAAKEKSDKEIEKKKELLQGFEDFKKSLRQAEANTQEEKFALELEKIDEEFATLQERALEQRELGLVSEQEWFDYIAQIDEANEIAITEADDKHQKIRADQQKKADEKILDDKIKGMRVEENLRQEKMAQAHNFFQGMQALSELAGKKGKAFAIAQIVVEQVSSVSRIISNLGIANIKAVAASTTTAGQPMVAINTVMAAANIAKGLASAKKAISGLKSNKKSVSGSAGAAATGGGRSVASTGGAETSTALAQQPTFSTVGQSGTNQIAEALGQGQPPVQAYVVAQDVTTAQSLENNIISSASIG
ncbi:MAG: hypothetical protein H8E55_51770 [Pelagibacterales bacterium]|nr:hypothetical protein [Pelagibacterales bacterium]